MYKDVHHRADYRVKIENSRLLVEFIKSQFYVKKFFFNLKDLNK